MNPANITREGAKERASMIDTRSYDVLVDLSGRSPEGAPLVDPEATFVSTSTIRFHSRGGASHLDLIADAIFDAQLDGEVIDASAFTGHALGFETSEGEHVLTVTALCRYSRTGEGLHRFVDPADDRVYLYSQFETADARRMYANFEQPDLKATFQLSVIAPDDWLVVSNSPEVIPSLVDEGLGRWDFAPTPPISTYITALVAGNYQVVSSTIPSIKGEIPAEVLCRASVAEFCDAERILDTTRKGFAVFEEHFGVAYPFEKYDQVFVPEFNAGAMENAGCVTIRDEYLFRSRVTAAAYEARDNTILHELAHMWFGDLVTMTWWDDLWLNESFAEWASHFAQGQISAQYGGVDPWASFANARKGWAYTQDQLPTTHPIAADMVDLEAVEQNFDGITYAKGASALKQLVAQVGQDAFLTGVRDYFATHAWGNTQLSDLLHCLTESSGRDLSGFSGEWLEKAGVNTLRAQFTTDERDVFTSFEILQTADVDWPTLRRHTVAVGFFDLVGDALVRRASHTLDIAGPSTFVDHFLGQPRPDLVLLNDADLTYAKVRLDARSLATAVAHIHQLDDPLARALLWGATWDMCRDGEMSPQDYATLVLRGIGTESDLTAVGALRRQAETAAIAYTAPERRDASREALVAGFATLLKAAEPGSDHQLAFASSLASSVDSAEGAEVLKGWLSGDEVPEGLVMDADMRWRTLSALARMGAAGEDEIAAEAEHDQTIAGAEQAAGVISAMASAETKAEAWIRATADPSVPNGTHQAICASFWQYGQEAILAPYADAYLEVAGAIGHKTGDWATRGHAASQAVLLNLFPAPLADRDYLDRVGEWLTQPGLSDAVARVVRERKDLAERALRNQERSRRD